MCVPVSCENMNLSVRRSSGIGFQLRELERKVTTYLKSYRTALRLDIPVEGLCSHSRRLIFPGQTILVTPDSVVRVLLLELSFIISVLTSNSTID